VPTSFPLVIVIVSGVLYHLAQKIGSTSRPWPMLAVAYGAAFVIALVLALVRNDIDRSHPGRESLVGLLLGLSAFGIEAGLFFVYRAGWPFASASVISSVVVTVVLAAIGLFAFGEHLTAMRAAGIVFAMFGAALIARGAA
jgi:drug/metabolite transporter (DMT)-like permease